VRCNLCRGPQWRDGRPGPVTPRSTSRWPGRQGHREHFDSTGSKLAVLVPDKRNGPVAPPRTGCPWREAGEKEPAVGFASALTSHSESRPTSGWRSGGLPSNVMSTLSPCFDGATSGRIGCSRKRLKIFCRQGVRGGRRSADIQRASGLAPGSADLQTLRLQARAAWRPPLHTAPTASSPRREKFTTPGDQERPSRLCARGPVIWSNRNP